MSATVQPKKRHGNRKPVIPPYTRPNTFRPLNAAMSMLLAYQKDGNEEGENFREAMDHFYYTLTMVEKAADSMEDAINTLDNMIP